MEQIATADHQSVRRPLLLCLFLANIISEQQTQNTNK